jgi:hypothetical protein
MVCKFLKLYMFGARKRKDLWVGCQAWEASKIRRVLPGLGVEDKGKSG